MHAMVWMFVSLSDLYNDAQEGGIKMWNLGEVIVKALSKPLYKPLEKQPKKLLRYMSLREKMAIQEASSDLTQYLSAP